MLTDIVFQTFILRKNPHFAGTNYKPCSV